MILTLKKWQQDECLEMGAAMAYYALFSLFPLVLVSLSILGYVLGPETETFSLILAFFQRSLPAAAAQMVETTLLHFNQRSVNAGMVGLLIMIFTASSAFEALGRAVNKIWCISQHPPERNGLSKTAILFLGKKLLAFVLVASTSILLLVSLLSNLIIKGLIRFVADFDATIAWLEIDELLMDWALHRSKGLLLLALAILLLFRLLPSAATPWKDLWPAALLTTGLLFGLQQIISHSIIELGAFYRSYGVIGGFMALMLWIYLTFQIFFLGCEFAYVYAHLFGSRRCHPLKV